MELLAPKAQSRVQYLTALLADIGDPDPAATAQRVLDHFGSLAAFAGADIEHLQRELPHLPHLPPALVAAQSIALAGIRERALTSRIDPCEPAFLDYLRLRLANRRAETLLAFFADTAGFLLCERTLVESEGHHIDVSAAAVLRVAIAVGANSFLLVHNHPSGIARPSHADSVAMRALGERAAAVEIGVIDHLIVGGSEVYSMLQGKAL